MVLPTGWVCVCVQEVRRVQWGLQSVVVCHSRSSQSGSVYCTMQRTCQGHFLSCSPWKYLAAACQYKPADPRLNNSRRHSHTAHRMHISEHAHKYTIPVTAFQLGLFFVSDPFFKSKDAACYFISR